MVLFEVVAPPILRTLRCTWLWVPMWCLWRQAPWTMTRKMAFAKMKDALITFDANL